MSSIKTNKKEESSVEKLNDSNSKTIIKNNQGDIFPLSLFQKSNSRQTKVGGELTPAYTAKFMASKNSIKRNRTLNTNEDKDKELTSNVSDTEISLKNLEHKYLKRSKVNEESIKSKKFKKSERIIVDNIEHIYSKIKKIPKKIKLQNCFIYLVAILIGILDWNIVFQITDNKLERNYCFTDLYQFDSCSIRQICKNYKSRINYIIYNKDIDFYNNNKSGNIFLEEKNYINIYYKQFFLKYSYILTSNQFLNTYQNFASIKDRVNFAIILAKKGQWNFFLRYFCVCQKNNYSLMILIMYCLGGILGTIILGMQADIRGRKKIIQMSLFITCLGLIVILIYYYGLHFYYLSIKKQFKKKYLFINKNNIEYNSILEDIYSQSLITTIVNKYFIVYLIGTFFINFGALPLIKTSLALLIENSTSEQYALRNFKNYNFYLKGCSSFLSIS